MNLPQTQSQVLELAMSERELVRVAWNQHKRIFEQWRRVGDEAQRRGCRVVEWYDQTTLTRHMRITR